MQITCVGGGPAGLQAAVLAAEAGHKVRVLERSADGRTYGFGVTFMEEFLQELDARDPATAELVRQRVSRWDDQVVSVHGRAGAGEVASVYRGSVYGYSIARQALIDALTQRAHDVGVDLRYGEEVRDPQDLRDADLVIAGDGVSSALRSRRAEAFGTAVRRGRNKYLWLGTSKHYSYFTYAFAATGTGWAWAGAYGFDDTTSTFVVEVTPQAWESRGFADMELKETLATLEEMFAPELDGHRLRAQPGARGRAPWQEFRTVTNERWHDGTVVLVGDAAHTTHFTVGSGTRLAMQDAMTLVASLASHDDLEHAVGAYERQRRAEVRREQREARHSGRWFESVDRYIERDIDSFAELLALRRSPLLAHLPVPAFQQLRKAAAAPGAGLAKRLLSRS